ncbi:MAG TPA: serine/threonine-protein kinase [Candidatus Paceibacterota bacterium]|nr:serine/threonine-protein kinase [Verrucomicrobiota bacterium]HSA10153.1 serine/threonine-protein kinase [Candidatus Paceibacterota bacterium]
MNTEPVPNRCPKCQAPLRADAPQGLCPKCLLAAVSTPTEAGQAATQSSPPPIEEVAAAFPQLQILELIGQGGMGVVYKARQPRLDRLVALKLLPQSLAADPAFAERFNREARVLARLSHPSIVTVYDFGQSGGFFFLLMEFVDGVNLRQAMQAGRFTPQQAMMLVPKICEALQFAHDEGILHRDIKPENILLDTRGRVKIADFGIAKLLGETKEKITLTASGHAIGTPHYMAPEQLEHPQDVDQRADIYSLGVVFYEMLTGELPIGRFAPPSTKSTADPRVDEVVLHALEKEREKRFRTAGEVKTSVEAIASSPAVLPGQAATAKPSPSPATSERRIPCYISTPEHLGTFTGQFLYIYTGKGELRLDGEYLTFDKGWQSTVIPLRDIRELGIGHYSRLAKPLRLDFLAVRFEQAGQPRTLLFTPCIRSGISLPWETNPLVADCLQAVREAVIARTGQAPRGPAPAELPGSYPPDALWRAIKIGLPIAVAAGAVAVVTILVRRHTLPATDDTTGGWFIFWVVCGQALVAFIVIRIRLWRLRQNLDLRQRTCPSEPPASLLPRHGHSHSTGMPPAGPSSQSASASATAVCEARATCYFNTPARMRDCFPSAAARVFTCRGELALDAEALTFTSTWRSAITIPLKDIHDLSIGQFQMWTTPWVMKYARINFLSVTFRREGQLQTVHLTPVEPSADNPARINDCVGRWFELVKKAVVAATGSAPHFTEPERLTVQAQRAWGRKGWPVFFLFMAAWFIAWFVMPGMTGWHPPRFVWPIMAITTGVLLAATLFSGAGFIRADRALKRGDLDAVTSDDPPAPEPAAADGGGGRGSRRVVLLYPILVVAVLLVCIAGWWSSSQRASSRDTSRSRPSTAGREWPVERPDPGTNVVLLTTPFPRAPENAFMASRFRCLLPAHYLARVLFVRWTNGVPEVWPGLCGYFKVGVASINADFALICTSLTGAPATNAANEVQWTVNFFGEEDCSSRFPGEPRYRAVELPTQLVVGPGRQGIVRLADHLGPGGKPAPDRSGIELRIFLEPLEHTPLRINPSELGSPNYVAEVGPGWTTAEAVKAIREWPIDK